MALPKSMQLLEYLTGSGWPDTFLYSSAAVVKAEPCLVLDFTTHQYAFAVDIAVLENISTRPIKIDQLLGQSGGSSQLRMVTGSQSHVEASALQQTSIELAPTERLVIPLDIVLLADTPLSLHDPSEEQKAKQASAQRFRIS